MRRRQPQPPDPTDLRARQLDACALLALVVECEVRRFGGESDCRHELPITTGDRDKLDAIIVTDPGAVVAEVRDHVRRRHPELLDHLHRVIERGRTNKWNAVHLDLKLKRHPG
jgi:hypothetical protein